MRHGSRAAVLCALLVAGATSGCATLFGGSPGARIVGDWRLDSLSFFPLRRDLPDSTQRLLDRYRQTTGTTSRQFRSGAVVIMTQYRADSSYEHTVQTRDRAQRTYRERGRWRIDVVRGQIWCRNDAGRACPHDRAVVERVSDREMVLHLPLTGRGTGIGQYFRLVRVRR